MKTDPTPPNRAAGLLTAPIRIALAIIIFAPVALLLKGVTKLGELLAEAGADLDYKWSKLAQDTAFLLHGNALKKAQEQAEELKSLRARWKFFHPEEETPKE